ncbi:hypothetical protein [Bacillus alkalicellulosilyticus]|uniref:hypothetical protein n=1 Tax=Alkalihalobacterium alkalicellulosilyticum TaxID=1912214 RepID=UPI000996C4A1|nr:hypothetical protein [Bacillus alkalicellulosilyticus]
MMSRTLKVSTLLILLMILLLWLPDITVYANEQPLPFLPQQDNTSENKGFNETVTNMTNSVNDNAPLISNVVFTILAIMFLIGIAKMAYALVTKTGMILKASTGTLIGIPVFIVLFRLFFIIAFTTTGQGIEGLATDVMLLLIQIGFYTSMGMILIGLLMKLFHKFLNHPEYARWSKRLLIGSITLALLTAIMPAVVRGI